MCSVDVPLRERAFKRRPLSWNSNMGVWRTHEHCKFNGERQTILILYLFVVCLCAFAKYMPLLLNTLIFTTYSLPALITIGNVSLWGESPFHLSSHSSVWSATWCESRSVRLPPAVCASACDANVLPLPPLLRLFSDAIHSLKLSKVHSAGTFHFRPVGCLTFNALFDFPLAVPFGISNFFCHSESTNKKNNRVKRGVFRPAVFNEATLWFAIS